MEQLKGLPNFLDGDDKQYIVVCKDPDHYSATILLFHLGVSAASSYELALEDANQMNADALAEGAPCHYEPLEASAAQLPRPPPTRLLHPLGKGEQHEPERQ